LRQAVSALRPQSAILFSRMFRDGAGQAVISTQAAERIAQWANAPVYVMTDTPIGTGAVGGAVARVEAFGKRAGELARVILTGSTPASLPFEIRTDTVPMFDWHALKRWGITESRLPPDSIVRFRPPSLWQEYRWTILGALLIFALQAAMITGLLLQRMRWRRAELELQRQREELAHVTRVSTVGQLATSVAHEVNHPLVQSQATPRRPRCSLRLTRRRWTKCGTSLPTFAKTISASEVIRRMRGLLRKHELAPQTIEINDAVEEVLKLLSIDASTRKVSIKFERTAEPPRVWSD